MKQLKNKISQLLMMLKNHTRNVWKQLMINPVERYLFNKNVLCISIDPNTIFVLCGKKSFSKLSIKYFKKYPLETGKPLSSEYFDAILSAVDEKINIKKMSCTLCVPKSWTILQKAEFPISVKENLSDVIYYEIDRLTPVTVENAYYDYKIIREDAEKLSIMLAVTKTDKIKPFISVLAARNIFVERITASPFAIKNTVNYLYKNNDFAYIAVNEKNYEYGIIIDGFPIISSSGTMAGIDENQIENIVYELKSLLEGFDLQDKRFEIAVSTDKSHYNLFKQKLTGLTVLNLDEDFKLNKFYQEADMHCTIAGTFLEAVKYSRENEFNLLMKVNNKKNKNPLAVTMILSIFILLIGAFYILAPLFIEKYKLDKIDDQINILKPEMKKVEILKREEDDIYKDIETIYNFKKKHAKTIEIIREMAIILPQNTWLTRLKIAEDKIDIEGYAASATEIIPILENSKYFQKVEFSSPTFRDPRQNNERFVLKMDLKDQNKISKSNKLEK